MKTDSLPARASPGLGQAQFPPSSQVTSFAGQKASGSGLSWPGSLVRVLGSLREPDWAGSLPSSLGSSEHHQIPLLLPQAAPDAAGRSLPATCWAEHKQQDFVQSFLGSFPPPARRKLIVICPDGVFSPCASNPATPCLTDKEGREKFTPNYTDC